MIWKKTGYGGLDDIRDADNDLLNPVDAMLNHSMLLSIVRWP